MLSEYLGICRAGKFKHLDEHELLVSAYPYHIRQNVLSELVTNAVVRDENIAWSGTETGLKQLPENYDTFLK